MVFNESASGPWQRGARGLPPSITIGAVSSASAAAAGGACSGGHSKTVAVQMLRLMGDRAVMLPAAVSGAPLLLSVELGDVKLG